MAVFTFHLARAGPGTVARALHRPPTAGQVPGLRHAECLSCMTLGAPILSPARTRLHHLSMFAAWDDNDAVDAFLAGSPLGCKLASGWHVRLELLRRWGHFREFDGFAEAEAGHDPGAPVVVVTLARMRLTQVPRFIRWGWPVEKLVRDHPGTILALAGIRPPRTVSTFSAWTSQRAMIDMVRGRGPASQPGGHAAAMAERERKDFHSEFTTLRFRPMAEFGSWEGRTNIIPPEIVGRQDGRGIGAGRPRTSPRRPPPRDPGASTGRIGAARSSEGVGGVASRPRGSGPLPGRKPFPRTDTLNHLSDRL